MRTVNSAKNATAGLIVRFVKIFFSFFVRTVFVITLGKEYLGVNGLFSNILTLLNLSELGIGTAIVFSLYKPLAERNIDKTKALLALYKRTYRIIGLVVLVLGVAIIPLLPYIIKGKSDLVDINLIYILYLFQSVSSYWFFAYRTVIISADQKSYIAEKIRVGCVIAVELIQVITLLLFKNFILYTLLLIFSGIVQNFFISRKAEKLYPYIKEKEYIPIEKEEKKGIFKNVVGLSMYKISAAVLNATDNIIISAFVGISQVGIYSNYQLITLEVNSFLNVIFGSFTASLGNLNVTESPQKKEQVFKSLNLMNFWLYGFCAVCLFVLFNPFIELWFGKDYLFNISIVIIIALNFVTAGLQQAVIAYKDACGLFWKGKFRPIASAITNLGLSILLAKPLGIFGILLATIISRFTTTWWFDAWLVHRYVFDKKPWGYYIRYMFSLLIIVATGVFLWFICSFFDEGILWFICRVLVCCIVPNAIFLLLYHKTSEFKYLVATLKRLIRKRK